MFTGLHLLVLGKVTREHAEQVRLALGLIVSRPRAYFDAADGAVVSNVLTVTQTHNALRGMVNQWAEDHRMLHHSVPSAAPSETGRLPLTVFFGSAESLSESIPKALRAAGKTVVVDPIGLTIEPWLGAGGELACPE